MFNRPVVGAVAGAAVVAAGCSAGPGSDPGAAPHDASESIAYTAAVSEQDSVIRRIDLAGGVDRAVSAAGSAAAFAAFAPDGSAMAYFAPAARHIMIADGDGGNPRPVGPQLDEGAGALPAFAPDGQQVAYVTSGSACALSVVRVDGSAAQQIVEPFDCHDVPRPAFTPDGRGVAFSRESGTHSGPGYRSYVVDLSSLDISEMSIPASYEPTQPNFSADGSKLVYHGANEDGTSAIFVANPDGSNPTKVVDTEDDDWLAPSLSADGSRITYSDDVSADGGPETVAVFVIDVDGNNRRQLTQPIPSTGGPGHLFPAWVPLPNSS